MAILSVAIHRRPVCCTIIPKTPHQPAISSPRTEHARGSGGGRWVGAEKPKGETTMRFRHGTKKRRRCRRRRRRGKAISSIIIYYSNLLAAGAVLFATTDGRLSGARLRRSLDAGKEFPYSVVWLCLRVGEKNYAECVFFGMLLVSKRRALGSNF